MTVPQKIKDGQSSEVPLIDAEKENKLRLGDWLEPYATHIITHGVRWDRTSFDLQSFSRILMFMSETFFI